MQQEGADKAGGARDEDRFRLRFHGHDVVELQLRLQEAAPGDAVVHALAGGRFLARRALLRRRLLADHPNLRPLSQFLLEKLTEAGLD
ncbi:hypothetical protein FGX01_05050, partial [Xylella fastidiosa subsp. multiplex]|nr:hypothetical protein [Xylella fastidiosa subsp. multiplex]